jgi:aryl-alcohol dehydrogenase-like predicted oxidoreductase
MNIIPNHHKIGLGTAAIGRPEYINIRQSAKSEFHLKTFRAAGLKMLNEAYSQGIRYFDTAPGYGMAEQLLIDWIKEKNYTDLEIATKWGYSYVANFNPLATVHEVKEHSLQNLNSQWEQSKKMLPNLSTYQIHSATFDSGVLTNTDVVNRLGDLKQEFGLRIGMSSTGANQEEVLKVAMDIQHEGKALFDVYQVTYNVLDQSLANITKQLVAQNKRVVVKEAMANGRVFTNSNFPNYSNLYTFLEQLANKYAVGIDAIAIRFVLDSINPFMVLSGASQKSHITANLKANTFQLTSEELVQLEELSVQPDVYWNERKTLGWN